MFLYSEFTQKIDSLLDTLMYGNVDNKDVFYQAFVHRSALNEYKKHFSSHNERLEFLGDAILEFVISERLFHDYPNNPEGWMTDVRSSLVRGTHLAQIATKLGFSECIVMARGETSVGGTTQPGVLADAMESFIGAIYLSLGIERVKEFIIEYVYIDIENILEEQDHLDPKSHLQRFTQSIDSSTPQYALLRDEGEDHEKTFYYSVSYDGRVIGEGSGSSKKSAQESAAKDAIERLEEWFPGV